MNIRANPAKISEVRTPTTECRPEALPVGHLSELIPQAEAKVLNSQQQPNCSKYIIIIIVT